MRFTRTPTHVFFCLRFYFPSYAPACSARFRFSAYQTSNVLVAELSLFMLPSFKLHIPCIAVCACSFLVCTHDHVTLPLLSLLLLWAPLTRLMSWILCATYAALPQTHRRHHATLLCAHAPSSSAHTTMSPCLCFLFCCSGHPLHERLPLFIVQRTGMRSRH